MMRSLSLAELAQACGVAPPTAPAVFSGVTTDSRQVKPGDLFVALRGERFDAHDFLADVQRAGAAAALVERLDAAVALPQLAVPDAVLALAQLAALNRAQFNGTVIGLTGSAGKTTTKEMIAAILAQSGKPLVTAGNLNNHIGVPLTLLRLAPEHDCAVIEMGASAMGEIRYLTQLVRPAVALVTTVEAAHIEGFGSIENIARGKREIFEGLAAGGTAVINLDNRWTASWRDALLRDHRVLAFSTVQAADVWASDIAQDAGGLRFVLHACGQALPLRLAFIGRHNVGNALAAAACCLGAGLPLQQVVAGLQAAQPYKGRLQSRAGINGCLVIDDSYNANPAAVRMAVDALLACEGDRILVLGDMAELGPEALALHAEAGRDAKAAGITTLLVTGELSRATADGFGAGAEYFPDWQSLAASCRSRATNNTVFLIKGSRSAGMDRVADVLAGTGSTAAC